MPDKPSWWLGKAGDAQPVDSEWLQVTSDNVGVSASSDDGKTTVAISYSGAILSRRGACDRRELTVSFNADGSLTIRAMHDGFPAHTMYVNGVLVYNYPSLREATRRAGRRSGRETVTYPRVPSLQQIYERFAGAAGGGVGAAGDPEHGAGPVDAGDAAAGDPDNIGPRTMTRREVERREMASMTTLPRPRNIRSMSTTTRTVP